MRTLALVLSRISSINRATKKDFPLPDCPTTSEWLSKPSSEALTGSFGWFVLVPSMTISTVGKVLPMACDASG